GGLGVRCLPLDPFEQRRSEVETDSLERVQDLRDATVGRMHARGDDSAIALVLDALVPVVERRCRRLDGDLVEPRIFPRRLVEMPVDDDRPDAQTRSTSATLARTSGNRSSPFTPHDPSASCSPTRGGWSITCRDAGVGRTPGWWRSSRYTAARKSTPSNHQ